MICLAFALWLGALHSPSSKGNNPMSQQANESILTQAKPMCFVASQKYDEAKKFYGETLGLKFLHDDQYGLMFAIQADLTLRIQKLKEFKPQPFTVFGWQVDDIQSSVASLSKRGVTFEKFGFPNQDTHGIVTFENGDKVAWFKDPDGNTLSIAQLVGK
jgi:catechol 2,3-dioxygenase-like lactoylglutathione lyase family enzyme